MSRYHIIEKNTEYLGEPYIGPVSGNQRAESQQLDDAHLINIVMNNIEDKFVIFDTTTRKLICRSV